MKCAICGKELEGSYWWRHSGYKKIQCFCRDCAASIVDEHRTNGLITSDALRPGKGYEEDDDGWI